MKNPRAVFAAAVCRTCLLLFSFAVLPALLSACAGEDAPVDNTAMLPENQRVSNVPWNKPESWEGRAGLGALGNDPRFNGGGSGGGGSGGGNQ